MTFLLILKTAFKNIAKNYLLFIALFMTQFAILALLSYVFVHYSIPLLTSARDIIQSVQTAGIAINSLENSLGESSLNALIENQAAVTELYNQMISSILKLLSISFLCYIMVNSINWFLSGKIAGINLSASRFFSSFSLLSAIFMIPLSIIIYAASNILFKLDLISFIPFVSTLISMICFYFLFTSFALLSRYDLKETLKHSFKTGYKNIKTLILPYLISIFLPVIILILISLVLESNFVLLISLIILFILSLNFGRIYFLTAANEIK